MSNAKCPAFKPGTLHERTFTAPGTENLVRSKYFRVKQSTMTITWASGRLAARSA
jgi:hypothetical protein